MKRTLLETDAAHGFFGNRLVYWSGATPMWGWHWWVGGRMLCAYKWVVYFEETE